DIEVPILNDAIGVNVASILEKQPEFNIKTTSIYEILKKEDVLKGVPVESHETVRARLKDLSRTIALSPTPEALVVLLKADLTSAVKVSDLPEGQFVQYFSKKLGVNGETIAKQVHMSAVNTRIRNEQALIAIKETIQGTGVAFIDKSLNISESAKEQLNKYNLSWDQ